MSFYCSKFVTEINVQQNYHLSQRKLILFKYITMEKSPNENTNTIFNQVAELSQSVNECMKNVNILSSQINKDAIPTEETNQHSISYLKWGKENAKLFADLTQNTQETIGLLERVNGKTLLKEIDVNPFMKNLQDLENSIKENNETQKYLKIITVGLKSITEMAKKGKPDTSIESLETILAFSDFLPEDPGVATSSPLN